MEDIVRDGSPEDDNEDRTSLTEPIAAFHPDMGLVVLPLKNNIARKPRLLTTTKESTELVDLGLEACPVTTNFSQDTSTDFPQIGIEDSNRLLERDSTRKLAEQKNHENLVITSKESITIFTNQGAENIEAEVDLPAGYIKVHNQEGVYLMSASKWPNLKEPDPLADDSQLTQEEDLMDNISMEGLEEAAEEDNTQGWVEQVAKKRKGKAGNKNRSRSVVATRASARVARDGVPIAEKAIARTREKMNFRKVLPLIPLPILMMLLQITYIRL
jgi:hypothetical protein